MTDSIRVSRRLTAVAFADVAGFSAAVESDDVRAVEEWHRLREEVLKPLIARHRGLLRRVVGDALFVEFASAVDAAAWALDVHRGASAHASGLAMRIGINVEDAIVVDDDLHGDGVNIAARIHALAQPGETVVTAAMREYVLHKVKAELVDLGEHRLKNITRPVHLYRLDPPIAAPDVAPAAAGGRVRWAATGHAGVAVLPFRNLSGDPREDYFGDGITEDIIAGLSRNRALTVIARHSTLSLRDRRLDAREIARELGVRYLVDGSVRRQTSTLRISAELNDAIENRTLWAERFQGSDDELFDFQDRIAHCVVTTIDPRIHEAEARRARAKPTENLDAYDCILRAFPLMYSLEDHAFFEAGKYLDRAIELDPFYAQAHAHKAWWYVLLIGDAKGRDRPRDAHSALACASRAMSLDTEDAFGLAVAGHVRAFIGGKPAEALELFERALELNPNSAFAWGLSALTLCYLGRPDEALLRVERARRLSPFDPLDFFWASGTGFALFLAGRGDEAASWFAKSRRDKPSFVAVLRLQAGCLGFIGRTEDARAVARDLLSADPAFRVDEFMTWYPLQREADRERLAQGLRDAGLPG